jgi:hypothetical protein
MSSGTDVLAGNADAWNLHLTVATPMTNVAEYGFEKWAEDATYYEYPKAANPVASGHTSTVPINDFGRDVYTGSRARIVSLGLSPQLGITNGLATGPTLAARFVRASRSLPARTPPLGSTT